MRLRKRTYTPPPDAIYLAGKRKASLTKAIRALGALWFEFNGSDEQAINEVIDILAKRRKKLDEV